MEKEIYDLLKKTMSSKSSVRLHNLYKGMPISYDAEVIDLDDANISLHVNKFQIACIFLEKGTYIQGKDFPFPLQAHLSQIDLERGDVSLTDVVKVQGGIGQRVQTRVEPEDPIWVSLQVKNALSSVTTRLADLSSMSLGVYMERFYFQPHIYRVGAELKVSFDLPKTAGQSVPVGQDGSKVDVSSLGTSFGRDQLLGFMGIDPAEKKQDPSTDTRENLNRISSDAVVIHFRPELYLNRYRIGLRLINDENSREILSQYISQRQLDLIREYRLVSDSLKQKNRYS